MDEASISRRISQQERHLSSLRATCHQLDERLDELYRLRARFDEVRVDFVRRKGQRTVALQRFSHLRASSRTAARYQDGMSGLLSGSHYRAAAHDLDQGEQRIRREIQATLQKLARTQNEIRATKNDLDRLYRQLRQAQIENAAKKD